MDKHTYIHGTGRRKTAVAQVKIAPGGGAVIINGRPFEEFFPRQVNQQTVMKPLNLTQCQDKYNITVKVTGGGVCGQAVAVAHGISRALVATDINLKTTLRQSKLLTRDSRAKERKKVGLKKARKAAQSPKR